MQLYAGSLEERFWPAINKMYFSFVYDTYKAVAQEEDYQRVVGSIPGFPWPHVEVSLGKTLNPTLALMSLRVYECVR